MRELLSTEARARRPKPIQRDRLRTRSLLCELNLWPPYRFHLISLEQWSQTSVSGMWSLSICCSGEPSAEKHRLTPPSAGKMLWTAGRPAKRALECRLRLSVTQRREKSLCGLRRKTNAEIDEPRLNGDSRQLVQWWLNAVTLGVCHPDV